MNIYMLPKIINNLNSENIKIKYDDTKKITISNTLHKYLIEIKQQINNYITDWDNYKKLTNPYEYIHSIIPNKKYSVSKLKPLSRSFYKFIEICNNFEILPDNSTTIQTFHLAEGPGGFIEAIISLHNNKTNRHYGMTLQSNNIDIPSWKKSTEFLKKNKHVIIENGPKYNGDLFESENLKYCYKTYKNSMDIITGDGGFDFSVDFNNQEYTSLKLIFSQICYALAMQKTNGSFVLKIFDIFTKSTLDLVYILNNFYDKVYITKPCTSRVANSEKYLICLGFKASNYDLIEYIISIYESIMQNKKYIVEFLDIELPNIFINKIEEYNAIFGQQQIENINNTINKIINKDTDNDELIKSNIQKCVVWCTKNNVAINNL